MEVDSVQSESDFATFHDMPNEIMQMIFRCLQFRDLLNASLVCHRWNQLVFYFFGNRIQLRVQAYKRLGLSFDEDALSEHRHYRNVSLSCATLNDLNTSFTESIVEHAENLRLNIITEHRDGLVDFLRKGTQLRKLHLEIKRFIGERPLEKARLKSELAGVETLALLFECESYGSRVVVKQIFEKNFPSVRHLVIRCNFSMYVDVLEGFIPRLYSLEVDVAGRLINKFIKLDGFISLTSLTLRMVPKSALSKLRSFRIDDFRAFLLKLRQLKTLSLTLGDPDNHDLCMAVYGVTNLEKLKFSLYTFGFRPFPPEESCIYLDGIQKMVNLRSLYISASRIRYPPDLNIQPLVHITELVLSITTPRCSYILANGCKLKQLFPNMKSLETHGGGLNESEAKLLVDWWPNLEILFIHSGYVSQSALRVLWQLSNLRVLKLIGCFENVLSNNLLYDLLLAMSNLQQFHCTDQMLDPTVVEEQLTKMNLKCSVFLNGRLLGAGLQ
ncbi:uncharacterized protein LOC131685061 [Topomyia yanbarensis]|uniref:uncharacterized protein LOC131685061 n=1 Tax=Topomyia yanbarensis TaxID=2498891 RepID=UPI00273AB74F|nr:uncharacterized protein LOC131685061 [Topomyia yanbarensis]XP_058824447.1 uncharacterized protein LOC131685061 [Topomyia yanbarensis]